MKLRIKLVTGEILRCEGMVILQDRNYAVVKEDAEKDEHNPAKFVAPCDQVIYIASDEVTADTP